MKILQINSVCGIRSTGRICTDLADVLRGQGFGCMIAYGRKQVPDKYRGLAIRIGMDRDVYIHAARSRVLDDAGLGSKAATKLFLEWVEDYNPDIIHLHNLHGYYINIELLFDYFRRSGKPVLWTLHDCWAFTGHCAHFELAGCDKWKTRCENCPQSRCYPKSILRDRSTKNFLDKRRLFSSVENLTFVVPSRWLADLLKQSFLGGYPVHIIHNGINMDIFKPTDSDFRKRYHLEDKKVILAVAAIWSDRKGYNDLLALSHMLNDGERLVIVGVTEKQKASLHYPIIGIPRTNSAIELAEIYSAADVFINPTYEDNFPTVNIEALACGTPVITYDTGGSPEAVDASCGVTVKKGNTIALYDVINQFLYDKQGCQSYALARARKFEAAEQFADYISLYKEIACEDMRTSSVHR